MYLSFQFLPLQMVTITGETGSGKSTQLPQYIYDSEKIYNKILGTESRPADKRLKICITQPRRVATVSMAKRLCFERNIPFGEEVSYAIRFDDRTSDKTNLRYVTDGILVRELINDPLIKKYNVVILDEAHERSLHTDILFALIKQAVLKREGSLKLVITSATLDTGLFSKYFNNCPIIEMKGRSYKVDILYGNASSNFRVDDAVNAAVRMHLHEGYGDILVFLTGSDECEMAVKQTYIVLQKLIDDKKEVPNALIYALYGAQSSADQARVFDRAPDEDTRKIIYSTNIAETSLTIDGIGFVVDSGHVKQKIYNPKTGMDTLTIVPISQVQAIQRAGRAGRTQEGKCYRMYSERFYKEQMIKTTVPEILRVNLTSLMLTMKCIGIHDCLGFDYMEKPNDSLIIQALKQLHMLNAIDENGKLTSFGRELCKYPMEPHFSKALMISKYFKCQEELLTVRFFSNFLGSCCTFYRKYLDENIKEQCRQVRIAPGEHG